MFDFEITPVKAFTPLSLVEVLNQLAFAAETMQWFNAKGKELLEAEHANNRRDWDELCLQASLLYRNFGEARSVKELFVLVIERGIADVTSLAKEMATAGQKDEPSVYDWVTCIISQLVPPKIAGLKVDAYSKEKRLELLGKLVVVAQALESTSLLTTIVRNMSPDQRVRDALMGDYINW